MQNVSTLFEQFCHIIFISLERKTLNTNLEFTFFIFNLHWSIFSWNAIFRFLNLISFGKWFFVSRLNCIWFYFLYGCWILFLLRFTLRFDYFFLLFDNRLLLRFFLFLFAFNFGYFFLLWNNFSHWLFRLLFRAWRLNNFLSRFGNFFSWLDLFWLFFLAFVLGDFSGLFSNSFHCSFFLGGFHFLRLLLRRWFFRNYFSFFRFGNCGCFGFDFFLNRLWLALFFLLGTRLNRLGFSFFLIFRFVWGDRVDRLLSGLFGSDLLFNYRCFLFLAAGFFLNLFLFLDNFLLLCCLLLGRLNDWQITLGLIIIGLGKELGT